MNIKKYLMLGGAVMTLGLVTPSCVGDLDLEPIDPSQIFADVNNPEFVSRSFAECYAILGLCGKGGAASLGVITAVLAVACNIFGACTRYYGYTYPLKDGTYSGTLQFIALIAFAVIAVVFAVATCSAKKKAKQEAAVAAE